MVACDLLPVIFPETKVAILALVGAYFIKVLQEESVVLS